MQFHSGTELRFMMCMLISYVTFTTFTNHFPSVIEKSNGDAGNHTHFSTPPQVPFTLELDPGGAGILPHPVTSDSPEPVNKWAEAF